MIIHKVIMATLIFLLMMFLLMYSFRNVSTRSETPYGVWQSQDPSLTLDVDPNHRLKGLYYGTYTVNDVTIDVYAEFISVYDQLSIYPLSALEPDGLNGNHVIFSGPFKMRNGQLICEANPGTRERTGYTRIVFDKIKDYAAEEGEQ